jgi:NTE family protein
LPRKISISEIQEGVNYLKGRDVFDLVNYEIIKVGEGEYKLKIIAKEKPISTFLKAGIHYDLLYKAGALINLTINNKILKSSHLIMEGVISERPRLNITYFKDNYYLPGFLFQTKFTQFNVDVPASALKNASINIQGNYMNIETKDWTSNIMLQKNY